MKACSKCLLIKPLDQFHKKGKGLRSSCRDCVSIYSKQHYFDKKEYYLVKASKNRQASRFRLRKFIYEYYKNHPCVDCGQSDPEVLEFDHLRDKLSGIANMINRSFSLNRIIEEISKCQVVCANCHRRRTAKQFKWYVDLK